MGNLWIYLLVVCIVLLQGEVLYLSYQINKNKKIFGEMTESAILRLGDRDINLINEHVYFMHHHQPMDAKTGKVMPKVKG